VTVLCWGCCQHAPHYDRGLCGACHRTRYGVPDLPGYHPLPHVRLRALT
jgi:hypothetical protein